MFCEDASGSASLERHWLTFHGLVVLFGLLVYVLASRALYQRRHPSAAIAWVVMLTLLPYLALPLYFMFGSRKVRGNPREVRSEPTVVRSSGSNDLAALVATSRRLDGPAERRPRYEHLRVHRDGAEALAALRELIGGATASIDVCTFVFARDALGKESPRC